MAFQQQTYPVSAHAVHGVELLAWSRAALQETLDEVPQLRLNIMQTITMHMRDALDRVQQLSTTVVGRVGCWSRAAAERPGWSVEYAGERCGCSTEWALRQDPRGRGPAADFEGDVIP